MVSLQPVYFKSLLHLFTLQLDVLFHLLLVSTLLLWGESDVWLRMSLSLDFLLFWLPRMSLFVVIEVLILRVVGLFGF